MKILAIDLGKFNSVACLFDTTTNQSEFETFATQQLAFEWILNKTHPDQVLIETSSISGWVHDLIQGHGYKVVVANPSADAWRWKNVKRKTDKDDALKLAKLAALEQISTVHVPTSEHRQYRSLVKYRKTLVHRVNRVQSTIRSLFDLGKMIRFSPAPQHRPAQWRIQLDLGLGTNLKHDCSNE